MKVSRISLLAAALSSLFAGSTGYNTKSSITVCATAYSSKSPAAPVKTATYQVTTYTTDVVTSTFTPVSTITPSPVVSTSTDTITAYTTYTMSYTFKTVTIYSETTVSTTSTTTQTVSSTQTVTQSTTSTSTITAQPSAGFSPVNPGASRKKRDVSNQVEARGFMEVAPARAASSAPGSNTIYPVSVICDITTTYSTHRTTIVTATSTSTTTLSTPTSTITTTSTYTSDSYSYVFGTATTTISGYETTTVTTTSTATVVASTTTTTQSFQATATYYAACGPNNQLPSDTNNVYLINNRESQSNVLNIGSTYDCCAYCLNQPSGQCAVSQFIPSASACRIFNNGQCAENNQAGLYGTNNSPGTQVFLSNSYCGVWEKL